MTEEQVLEKLRELYINDDTEIAHVEADDLLCDFLSSLGYEKIVQEYNQIGKWYA